MANSSLLAAHTRHQRHLAGIFWLMGFVLNLGIVYHSFRRARRRTQDGMLAGICFLFLLAFAAVRLMQVVSDYHTSLGDD